MWESKGARSLFGRDGITGLANVDINPEVAARVYPPLKVLDLPQTNATLPNFGGGTGALNAIDKAWASTARVSAGSRMPSSHNRAVE